MARDEARTQKAEGRNQQYTRVPFDGIQYPPEHPLAALWTLRRVCWRAAMALAEHDWERVARAIGALAALRDSCPQVQRKALVAYRWVRTTEHEIRWR